MPSEDMVFTLALLFGTGTLFYHNLSKLGIPYTVLMFMYGLLVGGLGYILPEDYGNYFDRLADIPPRLIFHIFLPILIFEGAYGMKIHAFRQVFWQVVALANPGLIINFLIVGVGLKYVCYPEWNWYAVMLLGSLLSATDPVAVVALLKDLGVDKRITAMVDGEAIMNDGTAIIAFTIFQPAASAGYIEDSWYMLVLKILQLTVLSVVFGVFCGFWQVFFLRRANNQIVQTLTTISFAYLSFFIADEFLETSGVLTLCFQGVYLSYNYPSLFPGKEGNMLTATWHFLVHLANTVIFALVGIIIIRDAPEGFKWIDLWYIIFLYLALTVARLVMILMLLPILNRFSYKLQLNDVGLLVHGGLRGAVAMTLALIVRKDPKIPEQVGIDFVELTTGIVVLTTVVNATTSAFVMEKLGHKSKEMNRLVQMDIGHKYVLNEADRAVRKAKATPFFRKANFAMIAELAQEIRNPYREMRCVRESDERVFNVLLMRAFKTAVWRLRDDEKISEDVVKMLTTMVADNIRDGTLISAEQLLPYLHSSYPQCLERMETFGNWFAQQAHIARIRYDEDFYGYLVAYNNALDGVEAALSTYVTTQAQLNLAHEWLSREREAVVSKIAFFAEDKPRAATAVITKIAGRSVFHTLKESMHQLRDEKGFPLPAEEALAHEVQHSRGGMKDWPSELEAATKTQSLHASSLCHEISSVSFDKILSAANTAFYTEDEELPVAGCVVVIVQGVVRVLGREDRELGNGAVLYVDEMLVSKQVHTKYYAGSPLEVLEIPFDVLRPLVDDDTMLESKVWKLAAVEAMEPLLSKMSLFAKWKYDQIVNMIEEGRVVQVPTPRYRHQGGANELVFFMTGSDMSGLVTKLNGPFVVPHSVDIQWSSGTILYTVVSRFNKETIANPVRRRAASRLIAEAQRSRQTLSANDLEEQPNGLDEVLIGDYGNEGLDSPVMMMPVVPVPIKHVPSECATVVPYFNSFQLEFVSMIERLSRAAQEYINFRETSTRIALSDQIDSTLKFLTRFCVQHFSAEALFYENLGLAEWNEHNREHEAFAKQVSLWLEQKEAAMDLCHDQIIAGMCDFVEHFKMDAQHSLFIKKKFPAAAGVARHVELPSAEDVRASA